MVRFGNDLALEAVSWDLALLAFCAVALFILGLTGGKRAVIPFLFGIYVGRTIAFLFSNTLSHPPGVVLPWYAASLVFIAAVIFVTWIFAGASAFAFLRLSTRGFSMWWQVLLVAVVGSGTFVSMLYPMLAARVAFSPLVVKVFLQPPLPLLWALSPLVLFLFIRATDE